MIDASRSGNHVLTLKAARRCVADADLFVTANLAWMQQRIAGIDFDPRSRGFTDITIDFLLDIIPGSRRNRIVVEIFTQWHLALQNIQAAERVGVFFEVLRAMMATSTQLAVNCLDSKVLSQTRGPRADRVVYSRRGFGSVGGEF